MKEGNLKKGPYLISNNNSSKIMFHLLMALFPIVIFSFYKNGVIPYLRGYASIYELFLPLIIILVAVLTSTITEYVITKYVYGRKDEALKNYLNASYSIFPGLFLALILPINTPLIIVIFGALVSTLLGKMIFGGFGRNIFNPALVGSLFVITCYALIITNNGGYMNKMELDTITSATPLSHLNTINYIGTYEEVVVQEGGLLNLFFGLHPGTLGETSSLLCLLAFVYLTFFKVIKWKIPVVYILTVFTMTCLIGCLNGLGIWYPAFHILTGGLMFGAIFMATDPVTSPVTPIGQILFGLFLGILTVTLRFLSPLPEGVLTSILTMNMLVFILDKIGLKARFDFKKALPVFLVTWILIVGLSFYISDKYKIKGEEVKDTNFKVIEVSKEADNYIYIVTQRGYKGLVKGKIYINNDQIVQIEIIESNEDFLEKVLDTDYLKQIINNQRTLEELDAVSGATVTSNALKKMALNTLNEHLKGENNE